MLFQRLRGHLPIVVGTAVEAEKQRAPLREPFHFHLIFVAAIAALAAAYLLQCATPLRLDDDTVDYLRMAAAMTDRAPVPTLPIPPGYSMFLSLMERSGLGSSFFFVLSNCVFIAAALYCVWRLTDYPRLAREIAIVATLLTVAIIKAVPIALPEAAFLATSLFAVLAMTKASVSERAQSLAWFALAVLAGLAAASFRTVGFALFPAIAWTALNRRAADISRKQFNWLLAGSIAVLAAVGFGLSARVVARYIEQAQKYYAASSFTEQVLSRIAFAFTSAGELFANLPFSRFRSLQAAFIIAGLIGTTATVTLVRRGFRFTPARVYLVVYIVVIAVWPNPAPRLLVPVIPLIAVEIAGALVREPRPRWILTAAKLYLGWLALTGTVAIAYTTRISLSRERFAELYGKAGGMADPGITAGNKSWSHVQQYMRESARMRGRYGR